MVKRAGKLRPSQVVTQFGPGALVDLPELSMVLTGIDEWNEGTAWTLGEPRLQRALGVRHFKNPPYLKLPEGVGGIPSRIFPRFLVCPRCNRLAPSTSFEFTERGSKHLCKAGDCRGKGKAPAYPVRFMVACANGHLDDFPWHHWVHPDVTCDAELRLEDSGKTGSITDLWVHCPVHGRKMSLGLAFGENGRKRLPRCRGNRPWLADTDPKTCDQELRVLLRGASNAYFPVTNSALSIPPWSDPLQIDLARYEDQLAKVDSVDKLSAWLELNNVPDLEQYGAEQLWEGLLRLRGELGDGSPSDLRWEEWQAFVGSKGPQDYRSEFQVRPEKLPKEASGIFDRVIKVVRLREVRALRGFTRIDPVPDIGDMGEVQAIAAGLAPLSPARLDWLPGVELRGEGVFVAIDSERLANWETNNAAVVEYGAAHQRAQQAWFSARALQPPESRGARFVLVHSLAHLLIRRFELEAGYSGSSLRERIYCDSRMAGFLIYTATPDSEGTLGGLVELARAEDLGPMLERAIEDSRLCANDPLCASRRPTDRDSHLNGAACHACLLLPETSCEHGNHYLDRAVVIRTLGGEEIEFVRE